MKDIPLSDADESQVNAIFQTQDPAAFLVHSKDLIWLAIEEIVTIKQETTTVNTLSVWLLTEPNIQLMMQIMQLGSLPSHKLTHCDNQCGREWTGWHERLICDLEGRLIQLLDPTIICFTHPGHNQMPTYGFQSAELITIAAVLFRNMHFKIDTLSSVP